jgi:hypothetical protein
MAVWILGVFVEHKDRKGFTNFQIFVEVFFALVQQNGTLRKPIFSF